MRTGGWMVRVSALAVAAATALAVGGCASAGKGDDSRDVTMFSSAQEGLAALAGDWKLIEIDGRPISEMAPLDMLRREPVLTIKPDGSAGGFSGVNTFGSELRAEALRTSRFSLGPIAMTRMAGPPELMSIESKLTLALSEPRRFSLRGNVLTLMPAEGRADPMVAFRRAGAAAAGNP